MSGPGSSWGEMTRERRNSAKSREQTRIVNSLRQFLTQDSRTVSVRRVDLGDLPALTSSCFLMALTAWPGPWALELTRSQMAMFASQFSEMRCSSVASRSFKHQDEGEYYFILNVCMKATLGWVSQSGLGLDMFYWLYKTDFPMINC